MGFSNFVKVFLVLTLLFSSSLAFSFGSHVTITSDKPTYHCGFDVVPGQYACEQVTLTIHSNKAIKNVHLEFPYDYKNGKISYFTHNHKKFFSKKHFDFFGKVNKEEVTLDSFDLMPGDTIVTLTPVAYGEFKWDADLKDSNQNLLYSLDPWFNSSFQYRHELNLTSSSSTLTDFQVMLVLNNSNINYSHTNDDGSDLRFTWLNETSGNETEIPFWIQEDAGWNESGNSYVWIKAPMINATNNNTYYYYYGNTTPVNTTSNGFTTFPSFFDDADDGSINATLWDTSQAGGTTITESSGAITIQGSSDDDGGLKAQTAYQFGDEKVLTARVKQDFGTGLYWGWDEQGQDLTKGYDADDLFLSLSNEDDKAKFRVQNDGNSTTSGTITYTDNIYYNWDLIRHSGAYYVYANGVLQDTETTNLPDDDLAPTFYISDTYSSSSDYYYIDFVFIHKYTTDAITQSFGSEEEYKALKILSPLNNSKVFSQNVNLTFTTINGDNYNISIDGVFNKTITANAYTWTEYYNLTAGNHSFFVEEADNLSVNDSVNFTTKDLVFNSTTDNFTSYELTNNVFEAIIKHISLEDVTNVTFYYNNVPYSTDLTNLDSETTKANVSILTPLIDVTTTQGKTFYFVVNGSLNDSDTSSNKTNTLNNAFFFNFSSTQFDKYEAETFTPLVYLQTYSDYFPSSTMTMRDNESNSFTMTINSTNTSDTKKEYSKSILYTTSPTEWLKTILFNYSAELTYGGVTKQINSTSNITTKANIYKLALGECNSTLTTKVLNMTVWDEDTLENITDWRMQIGIDYYPYSNSSYIKSYSYDQTPLNNTHYLCAYMPNNTLKLNLSGSFYFSKTGYTTREYYFDNYELTSTSKELKGYLSNYASAVTITLQDAYGATKSNYKIEVYRYDYSNAKYYMVTSLMTDSNGQTSTYLTLNTVKYKFAVYNPSGSLVYTSTDSYITSSTLTIVLPADVSTQLALIEYVNAECHFQDDVCDNTGCVVECSWEETQNISNYIDDYSLNVYGMVGNSFSGSSLCVNKTNTTGDGQLICNITLQVPSTASNTNITQFVGVLSGEKDGTLINFVATYAPYYPTNVFEGIGAFMVFALLITLAFAGRRNWKVALMLVILGFVSIILLGWINIPNIGGFAFIFVTLVIILGIKEKMGAR